MLRLKRIWETKKKLSYYIKELKPKKIGLPFGHGLGDMIMFMNPFEALCKKYPDIEFTLILQKGLCFEELKDSFSCYNGRAIFSSDLSYKEETDEFDIIADIDFPMSENQIKLTKGEYCCVHELGIDLANEHKKLTPVNKRYDFIDRHLRDIPPKISTLIGVLENCEKAICCVSGVFHTALSVLPPEKICLMERDFKAECFTKLPIKKINVKEYHDGEIKKWLQNTI